MTPTKTEVQLYRIFDLDYKEYGEAFGLCDFHADDFTDFPDPGVLTPKEGPIPKDLNCIKCTRQVWRWGVRI